MNSTLEIVDLWAYLEWSDHKIISILKDISPKEYNHKFNDLAGSIRSKASHIVSIYDFFIAILENAPIPNFPDRSNLSKEELLEIWKNDLIRIKDFIGTKSGNYPLPLANNQQVDVAHIYIDAALHTVHHRAQILTMLRLLGKNKDELHPRDTNMDYLKYLFTEKPDEIVPAK